MGGTAVVVGAGVGGLATALGLRRAGWRVSVRERREGPERYGTAFGIHPTAQAALERLGVGPAFRERAVPYRDARIRTPRGPVLASLPLERIERQTGRPELLISRPYLIDVLLAELERFGDVALTFGEPVEEVGELVAGHDLVVGADGLRSTVRAARFGKHSRPRGIGTVAPGRPKAHGRTGGVPRGPLRPLRQPCRG